MFETGPMFYELRRIRAAKWIATSLIFSMAATPVAASDILVGRAVLPAATFAEGPTSGQQLGGEPH